MGLSVMFLLQMTMHKAIQGEKLTEQRPAADCLQPPLLRRSGFRQRLRPGVRLGKPHEAARQGQENRVVYPQPREDLTMKHFRVCMMSLVCAVSLWTLPASAQEKFILGYGGGT